MAVCTQVLDQHIVKIDVHLYMAMVLVPMLLLSLVRNLKYLAPVSLASNVVMCAGNVCLGRPLPYRRKSRRKHSHPLLFVCTGGSCVNCC